MSPSNSAASRESVSGGRCPQPPDLGGGWVIASARDHRGSRGSPLTVRIHKRKIGAGDRGRTGDVQLRNESEQGNPRDDGEKEG